MPGERGGIGIHMYGDDQLSDNSIAIQILSGKGEFQEWASETEPCSTQSLQEYIVEQVIWRPLRNP